MRMLVLIAVLCLPLSAKGPKIPKIKPMKAQKYQPPKFKNSSKPNSTRTVRTEKVMRNEFQQKNPCPSTGKTSGGCPGYVIDHQIELRENGQEALVSLAWKAK